MFCEICGDPVYRRTLCTKHYMKWRRHGDPLHATRKDNGSLNHCGKSHCPAARKVNARVEYLRNSETYKSKGRKWRVDNKDRYEANVRAYLNRHDVKEIAKQRSKEWSQNNPDRKKSYDKSWRKDNRARDRANKARYRAAIRKATPPWLTDEHRNQILAFYHEAERLTKETGVLHEVDHIVPLQAGAACGLHVPWNLRVVTRDENNRRPRKWSAEELSAL
jgi:hypothetical protein